MAKRIVNWRPVQSKSKSGRQYESFSIPLLIAQYYRGELVDEILAMPRKNPIDFEEAVNLVRQLFLDATDEYRCGEKPGEAMWYLQNFVSVISDRGYHIELTGDEMFAPSEQPC